MLIKLTNVFKKDFKKLLKKDKFLIEEYEVLLNQLQINPTAGMSLGNGKYKIRIQNKSNNKGKSAGYRVITYTKLDDVILLVYIYSKSDLESISSDKIDEIIINYTI
ncbi:MAG: type II toxin-antitoxin system RelE/ParE family toxin [Sulfurimonas sp.]